MVRLCKTLTIGGLVALLGVTGCQDNPGTWGGEKVSERIAESLDLTDVHLEAREEGGFEGRGMRDGETISFTIAQDPEAGRMSWHAQGDRGFVEEGYYELQH